ncbi:MAG: PqqD family protein [Anaerolineae bacterium]|nr:PqqD family protein [Anaerolineae bacterium]
MANRLDARYRKDPSIVYREIAGEAILVPIRRRTADLESIYTLNPVAARIWDLLDGERTLGEIKSSLLVDFEGAEPEQVEADLYEFLGQLVEAGGVVEAE